MEALAVPREIDYMMLGQIYLNDYILYSKHD